MKCPEKLVKYIIICFLWSSVIADGELIPVTSRQDHVFDPTRQLLYITTSDGLVQRYDINTKTLLTPFTVGNNLRGCDISPDYEYLYVADYQAGATEGFIRKVDLNTGNCTNITYTKSGGESGAWDIKIANNGKALFTTEYSGSGWTPLRSFDLSEEIPTSRRSVRQRTKISRGSNRNLFFLTESNTSGGPTFTYDAATDSFPHSKGMNTFLGNVLSGVNYDGTLIATEISGLSILDYELGTIETLIGLSGGLVFDSIRNVLYAVDTASDEIVAIEMNSFQGIFTLTIGEDVGSSSHFGDGMMSTSEDGNLLFLSTDAGVRKFSIAGLAPDILVGLEVSGPKDVNELSSTQYSVTAKYYDLHEENVTESSSLWLEPDTYAQIDSNGLLTVGDISMPQHLTIYAQFTEADITIQEQLEVICYPETFHYFVDVAQGSDDNDGFTKDTALATIQKGIDKAEDGDIVSVYPGYYVESIDYMGKLITVQGFEGAPILEAPDNFAVLFYWGETEDAVIKNFIIKNSFMGIMIAGSKPTIKNVTVVNNTYGMGAFAGAEPNITSNILWNNQIFDLYDCQAKYSIVEDENAVNDPLFAEPENDDYHLKSERGRYVSDYGLWAFDDVTSPAVDAGEPYEYPQGEKNPNGGRINAGAFGGTPQASMSDWYIKGDLNKDGIVNFHDLSELCNNWLYTAGWYE